MSSKIRVAILFGGRSAEHEISLLSAQNVIRSLDAKKYEAVLIGISKDGKWYYQQESLALFQSDDPKKIALTDRSKEVLFSQNSGDHYMQDVGSDEKLGHIDVLFPVLHGTYGEDGAIQGLAKLANLPCVGSGILGSAVGMDKEVMKRLLRDAGIPIADFITLHRRSRSKVDYETARLRLGSVLFVKPANLGSSVGISKVRNDDEYRRAINLAFQYDQKVIIEEAIVGREIECAVLGNDRIETSIPGEIIPRDGFYSYEAKYIDEVGAILEMPAKLTESQIASVQDLSRRTYEVLECRGMARVDMFLSDDDRLIINEVNTIPGFTKISMYPKLWELSGKSNEELIDQLIQLALEEHAALNQLKSSVPPLD